VLTTALLLAAAVSSFCVQRTNPSPTALAATEAKMKKWQCIVCGFIYDEAEGLPDEGIAPGTPWEEVPEDWYCPDCGASKADFEMIELA